MRCSGSLRGTNRPRLKPPLLKPPPPLGAPNGLFGNAIIVVYNLQSTGNRRCRTLVVLFLISVEKFFIPEPFVFSIWGFEKVFLLFFFSNQLFQLSILFTSTFANFGLQHLEKSIRILRTQITFALPSHRYFTFGRFLLSYYHHIRHFVQFRITNFFTNFLVTVIYACTNIPFF